MIWIFLFLLLVFIVFLYLFSFLHSRIQKKKEQSGLLVTGEMTSFKSLRPSLILTLFPVIITLISGIALVAFFAKESTDSVRTVVKKQEAKTVIKPRMDFIDSFVESPKIKIVVIKDKGSELNDCTDNEIIVLKDGEVNCLDINSDEALEILERVNSIEPKFSTNVNTLSPEHKKIVKELLNSTQQQSLLGVPNVKKQENKPLKDKYAEVIYFFFLVMGVLGKYFWDYSESKEAGENVSFSPNRIVLSLIIAFLVYYSVQQGLEKEASSFAFRGALFAFYNGFAWQTIIKSSKRTPPVKQVTA